MPKSDLVFEKRFMNAAGSLGFAPDPRAPIDWDQLGAFITNPVSRRPRVAADEPALIEYLGGFLLHTGLPNPGFRGVLEQYARMWERSSLPVIVNLMADRPEETSQMVRALEGRDNLLAVEIGFAPLLADDLILLALEMSLGELPLIVSLPFEQLLRLGPRAVELGAAALSIASPRGSFRQAGSLISGRLFGPSLFPQTLRLVQIASAVGLPIIGGGGIFTAKGAQAMLEAGAMAVQLDASLWIPNDKKKSLVQ